MHILEIVWRAGTTRDEVSARLAEALARIARPRPRKLQRDLDRIGMIWSPPEHLHTCLGGWVHWQVPARAEQMAAVVAHCRDPRPDVRRAVMVALAAATPHVPFAAEALVAGLRDPDRTVRINAARALASHPPWGPLRDHVLRALGDPLWTVRWYAAVAIAHYGDVATACVVLCSTVPDQEIWWHDAWLECATRIAAPSTELAAAIHERQLRQRRGYDRTTS
jgi:HEAT repeat protein